MIKKQLSKIIEQPDIKQLEEIDLNIYMDSFTFTERGLKEEDISTMKLSKDTNKNTNSISNQQSTQI